MAYAAVISLKQTIDGLLNSPRFSGVFSTTKILKSAHFQAKYLQQVLERSNGSSRGRRSWERLDALEALIRDCAYNLEDVLESFDLSSEEESENGDEEVRREVASFTKKVKKMETDYIQELSIPETEEDKEDEATAAAAALSEIGSGVEIVGQSEAIGMTRYELLSKMRPDDTVVFLLLGGRGSGRSIVAKTIFEDLCEGKGKRFERCAWVTTGMRCEPKQVLISIIAQIDGLAPGCEQLLASEEEEKLGDYLYEALEEKVYMIVLDDVHNLKVVECLRNTLPAVDNGSIIFITTHLGEATELADYKLELEPYSPFIQQQLWYFLLFLRAQSSDARLEEAAVKVLENCQGHYVSAVKAFLLLMRTERAVEEWMKIALDEANPIFMVTDEIKELGEIEREVQYSFKYNWHVDDRARRSTREYLLRTINLPNIVEEVKMRMYPERFFSKMRIMSIFGMAGIGKSTFVRNILKDTTIVSHFDPHVWITLGPKYHSEDILIDILAQVYPDNDKLRMEGDINLVKELCAQLCRKRCLIVLDDVWSTEPVHLLKKLFPNIKGIILVTTRLGEVAELGVDKSCYRMQLLDNEESWTLLRQKVFGKGECPPEMVKAGQKIAEKCDGLPLLILTVGDQLLKVEISERSWNNIACGKEKSVFMNAHHQISGTLLPSYQNLPQHLKACFLYMGSFCEKIEVPTFKLTDLLIAEGFLEVNSLQVIEDFLAECLSGLVEKSLALEHHEVFGLQRKRCRLHVIFWHLSNSEAMKSKFFHAMNTYDDCSIESIRDQRRLCIRNNILLGFKDVQESMRSNSSAHSLMCVGPVQQYPVPFNFDMKLLRVMNALTIRLYEFPIDVLRQVHLRYLSLTCNGKVPTSMSNLWKLQCLIVKRFMNIKSSKDLLVLPVEIWDMKELKHLEVMGGYLPDNKGGAGLLNLSALLDVSAESCREEVLKWIPNLKRLTIRIELTPGDEGNSFHYLNNISSLQKLESLKCVVSNPQIKPEFVPPLLMLPSSIKRLSLSGFGYPWEHMSMIGDLENLEVLKLKHYAFQGPKWEMNFGMKFLKLKFLVIKDTNLVHWRMASPVPSWLNRISIKHCYKLQELPSTFHVQYVRVLDVEDCNSCTQTWARKTAQAMTSFCKVEVDLSWIAGNIKNHS